MFSLFGAVIFGDGDGFLDAIADGCMRNSVPIKTAII